MIIDSSALIAALLDEPTGDLCFDAIGLAERPAVGSPNLFETDIVVDSRRGRTGRSELAAMIAALRIEEIPFGPAHRDAAAAAFAAHGKGRSPTGLNFGDCMAYAVATVAGQPLLTLDGAFAATDVELVPLEG